MISLRHTTTAILIARERRSKHLATKNELLFLNSNAKQNKTKQKTPNCTKEDQKTIQTNKFDKIFSFSFGARNKPKNAVILRKQTTKNPPKHLCALLVLFSYIKLSFFVCSLFLLLLFSGCLRRFFCFFPVLSHHFFPPFSPLLKK